MTSYKMQSMIVCDKNTVSALKEHVHQIVAFIGMYNTLIDAYVLDYFVENHWKKLPLLWQNLLKDFEPMDMAEFLDCKKSIRTNQVWPLSLLAFRRAAFSLALLRTSLPSLACINTFFNDAIGLEITKSDGMNDTWEKFSEDITKKSCQHHCLPELYRRHVKPKKQHEIIRLSQLTSKVLCKVGVSKIMDIGSGLGHLSRFLSLECNFDVITVEAELSHISHATNFDNQLVTSLNRRHANSQQPDSTDGLDTYCRNSRLPKHFESYMSLDSSIELVQEAMKQEWCVEDCTRSCKPLLKPSFALVGLHTCGDLAATLLKLYTSIPEARVLFSVGCCYMKLSTESKTDGYPLSEYVQKLKNSRLSFEAREIACHALEKYISRLRENSSLLKIHCYRAVLEKVILSLYPHIKHLGLKSVRHAEKMKFHEYAHKAISRSSLSIPPELLLSDENEICLQEWKKVVIIYSLRLLAAPVVESLILLDRMLYLFSSGYCSCIVPIFEPSLSPRNLLLLSVKK